MRVLVATDQALTVKQLNINIPLRRLGLCCYNSCQCRLWTTHALSFGCTLGWGSLLQQVSMLSGCPCCLANMHSGTLYTSGVQVGPQFIQLTGTEYIHLMHGWLQCTPF